MEHTNHMLQVRDDYAKRPDYAGRMRHSWQAGAYYTLGVTLIIPDEQGRLSLKVQGIHWAGNDHTVMEDLEKPSYPSKEQLRTDEAYIAQRHGLSLLRVGVDTGVAASEA